jgi:hypothetical protein
MAGIFEDRERGYEAKWAHDEETHFKVIVRRNSLLGQWAAGEMGLSGSEAEDYVQAVVQTGMSGKGADQPLQKIRDDFAARKIAQSDPVLQRKIQELLEIAQREIAGQK